jgi:hypothetical protein
MGTDSLYSLPSDLPLPGDSLSSPCERAPNPSSPQLSRNKARPVSRYRKATEEESPECGVRMRIIAAIHPRRRFDGHLTASASVPDRPRLPPHYQIARQANSAFREHVNAGIASLRRRCRSFSNSLGGIMGVHPLHPTIVKQVLCA